MCVYANLKSPLPLSLSLSLSLSILSLSLSPLSSLSLSLPSSLSLFVSQPVGSAPSPAVNARHDAYLMRQGPTPPAAGVSGGSVTSNKEAAKSMKSLLKKSKVSHYIHTHTHCTYTTCTMYAHLSKYDCLFIIRIYVSHVSKYCSST